MKCTTTRLRGTAVGASLGMAGAAKVYPNWTVSRGQISLWADGNSSSVEIMV
jgi:hypothetical protein